jgi:hypothetical protein
MNAKQLEQILLLEQSGELSAKQRRLLDQELAASAETRRLREQLRGLAAAIPSTTAQPAFDAAARINARLRQHSKPTLAFLPAWKPALAAAAALALLLGVRAYRANRTPAPAESAAVAAATEEEDWTDPLDTEFTELESLIDTMSADNSLEITEI